jgi:hypothetical protein
VRVPVLAGAAEDVDAARLPRPDGNWVFGLRSEVALRGTAGAEIGLTASRRLGAALWARLEGGLSTRWDAGAAATGELPGRAAEVHGLVPHGGPRTDQRAAAAGTLPALRAAPVGAAVLGELHAGPLVLSAGPRVRLHFAEEQARGGPAAGAYATAGLAAGAGLPLAGRLEARVGAAAEVRPEAGLADRTPTLALEAGLVCRLP